MIRPWAVAVVAGLVLNGCSTDGRATRPADARPHMPVATAPGFDGREIRVGIISPSTGVSAPVGRAISDGEQRFWDAVNAEGGIGGKYPVRLELVDAADFESVAVQASTTFRPAS